MRSRKAIVASMLFLFLELCLFSAHSEQFYRWVDKAGHITFSDSPNPPSPDHQLMETKNYTPTPVETRDQGLLRLEEMRAYNREHPLPSEITRNTSEPTFSKAECEEAIRHHEIETESLTSTRASVAAAETRMRAKCNRPERPSRSNLRRHRQDFDRDHQMPAREPPRL
ncbi:exported hypothetical protein [Gammaproteobacteria bacterium]